MTNAEKYREEIKNYERGTSFCTNFIRPKILKLEECHNISCGKCQMLQLLWLMDEYEEPEVDWSKVEIDTPILVRDSDNNNWEKRHFAKYKDGKVYAWVGGNTSWTESEQRAWAWNYAKLAEGDDM